MRKILILVLITILSTFFLWFPFLAKWHSFLGLPLPVGGMTNIIANYDGPNYIIIAKTWYQTKLIESRFSLPISSRYFAAHFPGFPLLIWFFGKILPFTQAMLVATLFASALAATIFYLFLQKFKLSQNPFWLAIVFLFLPARFFAVRSVGSPEPFFIASLLASFSFFKQKKYLLAGIFGALAQVTKSPGILIFFAYLLILLSSHPKIRHFPKIKETFPIHTRVLPLFLIPLSTLAVFFFYQIQTGDFLAYFHSGDNFHLTLLPLQAFNSSRTWLSGIWFEDIIWLYLLEFLGVIILFQNKQTDLGIFAAIFTLATVFVSHRDLSRYSLPVWPFLLIGFDRFLQNKAFKIAFILVLPAIYLFSLNFISGNIFPISDWAPFL